MILKKIRVDHQHTLKYIPFFFTFANALLGLLAVFKAIDDQYIVAVYCILLAAFMDSVDGRLARLFNATSNIGAELDSLCDAISFCFAPVLLLYSWQISDFGVIGLAVLGMYLCAGLFRLARFNVFHKDSKFFLGLPTPMAAFFLLSFILYRDWFESHSLNFIFHKAFFSLIILFIAFLMISNVTFPSFKYQDESRKKWWIASLVILLVICYLKKFPVLFIAPLLYIFSGLFFQSYLRVKKFIKLIYFKTI